MTGVWPRAGEFGAGFGGVFVYAVAPQRWGFKRLAPGVQLASGFEAVFGSTKWVEGSAALHLVGVTVVHVVSSPSSEAGSTTHSSPHSHPNAELFNTQPPPPVDSARDLGGGVPVVVVVVAS